MSDQETIFTMLGGLKEAVDTIKKNTEVLPDLALKVDRLETQNKWMIPIVRRQQKAMWMGGSIISIAWAGLLAWFEGGHKLP
jgi:hypothetical protein